MNPIKPGWKSTEFYVALAAQVLAILTLTGVITTQEAHCLEEAVTRCLTALFLFGANAWVVVEYIRKRTHLKILDQIPDAQAPTASGNGDAVKTLMLLFLGGAGLLALAGPAHAGSMLPWRSQVEQRLRDQNNLIAQLIAAQRQAPAPAAPQIIVMPQPQQTLPIAGDPRQTLPIAGDPRQMLPIPGDPRQQLPVPGDPRQALPAPGTPQQALPIAAPPRQNPQSYTPLVQRALAWPAP